MRGIKTLALRTNGSARMRGSWRSFGETPAVERIYYCADPKHPDTATIKQLFAPELFGAILSFEIQGADKAGVLHFMNRLKMIVPGTSLGDVHTLLLYPTMASHRDIAPKQRERMGIKENLVRVSTGIEAVEDIYADLDAALRS